MICKNEQQQYNHSDLTDGKFWKLLSKALSYWRLSNLGQNVKCFSQSRLTLFKECNHQMQWLSRKRWWCYLFIRILSEIVLSTNSFCFHLQAIFLKFILKKTQQLEIKWWINQMVILAVNVNMQCLQLRL